MAPDFSGPSILGYLQHPATLISIVRDVLQSSYLCREAIPAFAFPQNLRSED